MVASTQRQKCLQRGGYKHFSDTVRTGYHKLVRNPSLKSRLLQDSWTTTSECHLILISRIQILGSGSDICWSCPSVVWSNHAGDVFFLGQAVAFTEATNPLVPPRRDQRSREFVSGCGEVSFSIENWKTWWPKERNAILPPGWFVLGWALTCPALPIQLFSFSQSSGPSATKTCSQLYSSLKSAIRPELEVHPPHLLLSPAFGRKKVDHTQFIGRRAPSISSISCDNP